MLAAPPSESIILLVLSDSTDAIVSSIISSNVVAFDSMPPVSGFLFVRLALEYSSRLDDITFHRIDLLRRGLRKIFSAVFSGNVHGRSFSYEKTSKIYQILRKRGICYHCD